MAYVGRGNRIKTLKKDISNLNKELVIVREDMLNSKIDFPQINNYNRILTEINCLTIKLDREIKYMKPQQYMDEVSVPGINIY